MGTENLGPPLTSAKRIHSIGKITFPPVDYFRGLLTLHDAAFASPAATILIACSASIEDKSPIVMKYVTGWQ